MPRQKRPRNPLGLDKKKGRFRNLRCRPFCQVSTLLRAALGRRSWLIRFGFRWCDGGHRGWVRCVLVTQPSPSPRRRPGPNRTLAYERGAQWCTVGQAPAFAGATECCGCDEAPAGERGITPGCNGRRPVRGCSNRTSVAARLSCERRTGNRTKPSGRPCGIGGRRCGLASWPSYPADWLRCLARVPIAPAPAVLRRW